MRQTVTSYRVMFKFWLNVARPDEKNIAETIDSLKENRSFSSAIRDGIRLINDLRQGSTEVLHELFPWVLEDHSTPLLNAPEEQVSPVESRLQERFDRMEELLASAQSLPLEAGAGVPNLRKMVTKAPLADDDLLGDLEIKQAKSDENPSFNMMISSVNMGIAKLEELPSECIEYGIRRGKLADSARQFITKSEPKKPPEPKPKGPKAMDVPQFDAPDIDLDDLDFDF